MSSTGPLAYVTGASSGIGLALARALAGRGWRLALVARRLDALEAARAGLGLDATRCALYAADVTNNESIVAAGRACIAAQGLPDLVIAAAGISVGVDTALCEDLEVLRRVYETNTIGLAATLHPFIAPMRQRRRGTLVGVASVAAIRGLPGHAAYCGSKAAVVAHCESLRGECRTDGVRVVTLVPGYVDTPLTQRNPYRMPFLMTPQAFADAALRAIDAGGSYRVVPWQMGVVAKIMRALPDAWFDRLVAGRGRKPRAPASGTNQ